MDDNTTIEHYGVKGMKWGVRKDRKKDRVVTSDDYNRSRALRSKDPRSLSNKELQTLNERLNLEANYSRLNPSRRQKGEAWVRGALATATLGTSIYKLATSKGGKAAIRTGKKIIQKSPGFKQANILRRAARAAR